MRLNRRVPNGTHGGVRGRGYSDPSYSIAAEPFTRADAAIFLAESFALADIHALCKKPFPQQVVRCERKPAKAES